MGESEAATPVHFASCFLALSLLPSCGMACFLLLFGFLPLLLQLFVPAQRRLTVSEGTGEPAVN